MVREKGLPAQGPQQRPWTVVGVGALRAFDRGSQAYASPGM